MSAASLRLVVVTQMLMIEDFSLKILLHQVLSGFCARNTMGHFIFLAKVALLWLFLYTSILFNLDIYMRYLSAVFLAYYCPQFNSAPGFL